MKNANFPFRRILVPSGKNYRTKLSVFLICAAISFFMWGLIKLSRVYEAPIKYNINYTNIPSNKILVHLKDTTITLFVKARGLELYSKMFNPEKNWISMDLSGIKLLQKGNSFTAYLRTGKILKEIASQLPQDYNLIGVEPDTLHLMFEQEHKRKVPIEADLSLSFIPQYQLYDSVKLSHDSVTIAGIKSVIDTIYKVKTEHKSIRNLKNSRLIALKLIKPKTIPMVTLSTDSITVEISVERFTEAEIEVPIVSGDSNDRPYRTFPDKIILTCKVAMREYERLDPSLFSVAIDYNEASLSGNNLAKVIVVSQPSFAKVIRIEPERVEFLFLK